MKFGSVFKLIAQRPGATFRQIISYIILGFVVTISVASYNVVSTGIKGINEGLYLDIVLKPLQSSDSVNLAFNQIKFRNDISDVRLIKPEEAFREFSSRYGEITNEIMPENPFPTIIKAQLKTEIQNIILFENTVKTIKLLPFVDEVIYNHNLAETVFIINKQVSLLVVIIAFLLFVVLLLISFSASRADFKDSVRIHEILNSIGELPDSINIYIYLSSLMNLIVGVGLGSISAFLLWTGTKDTLIWFSTLNENVIFISLAFAIIFGIITIFISSINLDKKE